MAPPKDLSIIIVNYNQEQLTIDCLNTILKNTRNLEYEIVLVDNGSRSGSLAEIKQKFTSVLIIEQPENSGFGRANNLGAEKCSGEIILFLNNDAKVQDGALEKMVNFLKNNQQAAAAGGRLLTAAGEPDLACADLPNFRTELLAAVGLDKVFKRLPFFSLYYRNFLNINQPVAVPVISGADLMIKRNVFEKLGGFDENFFFYYEDTDLCLRISRAGYNLYFIPDARIIHQRGATISDFSSEKFLRWRQSRLHFYKKNYPRRHFLLVKSFMLFTLLMRLIIFPVFWLGKFLGFKKNLENYPVYFAAWRQVKNFE